jgi:23S rRNA (uracil1939-C5)-methyltransferase
MNRVAQKNRSRPEAEPVAVTALSHDGRGIAKLGGKTVFVDDALPGETVGIHIYRRRRDYDEARLTEMLTPAAERVTPKCAHFGVCGGCALQHLAPAAQLLAKQQTLLDNLQRIGGLQPVEVMPALAGPEWGYRRRARLSARRVDAKQRVVVGFTERSRPFVTDTQRCEILDPKVAGLVRPLGDLFTILSIADRIPQVELAVADNATVLVLRVLAPPTDADRQQLLAFERQHGVRFYLQAGKPEDAVPLQGEPVDLYYGLTDWDVKIGFQVTDFIQVNGDINRRLVKLALDALAPESDHRVLDLFCGLGNFTLPLARVAAQATGIEGGADLVARARKNAGRNGIGNAEFEQADLFAEQHMGTWFRRRYDRILLDPPRAGAREIIAHFPRFEAQRIVYVSCHPATLARDAKVLVEEQGWRLQRAGVLDMFPHTAHVESIAVFERG